VSEEPRKATQVGRVVESITTMTFVVMMTVVYEGAWFSAGGMRQAEQSGRMPVIDSAVGDEHN